jgi:hypothetical protein
MALWNKVKTELDRAGRAAQTAIDEGKLRLEAMRSRQLADKAAQALGYAVFRARQGGQELEADAYARLSGSLAAREAEAAKLEEQIQELSRKDAPGGSASDQASSTGGAPPG